jgi:Flp pilus assembly protein TadD
MSLVNDLLINLEERRGGHTDQQAVFADLSPAVVPDQSGPQIVSWRIFSVFIVLAAAITGIWLHFESSLTTATEPAISDPKALEFVRAPAAMDSGVAGKDVKTATPANTSMVDMLSLKFDDVLSQITADTKSVQTIESEASPTVPPEQAVGHMGPARALLNAIHIEGHNQDLQLKLELEGIPVYETYTLGKPDRLVVELENAEYGMASLDWSASPHIRKIRTGQHDDRLRIVFDLSKSFVLADTKLSSDGNSSQLLLSLVDPAFQSPQPEVTAVESLGKSSDPGIIENRYMEVKPRSDGTETVAGGKDHYQTGLQLYQQRRFNESATELQKVIQQDPTHARAQYYLALALLYAGKPGDAEQQLDSALLHIPENSELKRLYAHILVDQGKSLEALAILADSPPPISSDIDYHAMFAALLQDQQMHLEAVDIYKNLVRLRPDNGVWWMGLGISLEALSLRNEALDAYRQSLKIGTLPANLSQYVSGRIQTLSRDRS